jgi:hypothetical protein
MKVYKPRAYSRRFTVYKNICQLTTCKLFDDNFNFRVKILSIVHKSCILNRLAAFSDRININSLILMILHSMQSAILDDKSSPRAYPRDEIAAQNGSTMSGFGRHLTDFLKYVNYEMPAEEAS